MKALEINCEYYCFPQGVSCIEDFVKYANEHYNSFVELVLLESVNCCFPYFIEEEKKQEFVNIATAKSIREAEVTVLSRSDYDLRLQQVINTKCINCIHYEDDTEEDNFKGHRGKLSLDGECWCYEKNR